MPSFKMIDIHAHLDDERFEGKRDDIINAFLTEIGTRLVTVSDPYSVSSISISEKLLEKYPSLLTMSGAHPHNASDYNNETENKILHAIRHPRLIALGEIGLDFHYNFSPKQSQINVFRRQIHIAEEAGIPILIHSRNAEKEILSILKEEKFKQTAIFHCYTGGPSEAKEIVARGYYLSFSGIITFKNAGTLRDILVATPIRRIFLETDSPYLSPEPYRGQTNSPLHIVEVYKKASEILRIEMEQLQNAILANFHSLWKLP